MFGVLIGSFDFLDQSDAKPKDGGHEVVTPSILWVKWSIKQRPDGLTDIFLSWTLNARGVLSSNRLIGMCRWMGSHFHDWIDSNGAVFSLEF